MSFMPFDIIAIDILVGFQFAVRYLGLDWIVVHGRRKYDFDTLETCKSSR
jgi:hypothetical protein